MTQGNLAFALASIAKREDCPNPKAYLKTALAHITNALTVIDPDHMPYDHATAIRLKQDIESALARL